MREVDFTLIALCMLLLIAVWKINAVIADKQTLLQVTGEMNAEIAIRDSYLEGAILFIPKEDLKWWKKYKKQIDYGAGR